MTVTGASGPQPNRRRCWRAVLLLAGGIGLGWALARWQDASTVTAGPLPFDEDRTDAADSSVTSQVGQTEATDIATSVWPATKGSVLRPSAVVLSGSATDKLGAIEEAGALLVATGAVDPDYVTSMHDRERSVSTYLGNYLAIPHGTNSAKDLIHRSAVAVVRYPDGIEWNGNQVKFVVAIAGAGQDHLALLAAIAEVFLDEEAVGQLIQAETVDELLEVFAALNS